MDRRKLKTKHASPIAHEINLADTYPHTDKTKTNHKTIFPKKINLPPHVRTLDRLSPMEFVRILLVSPTRKSTARLTLAIAQTTPTPVDFANPPR
ncbi:hypothetical protein Sinac_7275 [Singulisphaera acidiphila DSM 18658]|uniref:Uncharacterized protein n=1 Tax=Singulisphaera acidiphila (strain ATCC BAA-1392 / DSM 18658 / VKM B-2454 / MOB10) TaxID=886293 RepID=L0DPY4_SINAD|nr:hypothetical protein Sinac_7275 [Singulisphaera acidiphila DSM 18658]